ncbi:MAG: hypothetical protein H3C50_09395 [Kiritimatiellae bacterium]|nr:hypothetical protein [Kiritimatiellia bacterium]MCO5044253.1 hypothetical protein [Kiritimatiellia bacterium]MCO5061417.1 hypothetical protein [Kiritimatiellia bacterium]MCO5067509.1 hypothetical protein [Kiritimatiellia bacterium]MCO6400334.1 hypothetical protein [Verrucomicrobiota bacterium]
MKSSLIRLALPLFAAALFLQTPAPAVAQQPAGGGSVPLIVRKVSGGKVETPEYQLKKSQFVARTRQWFQIIVDYDTAPDWLDEATFTYYVLVRSKKPEPGKNPITLFKGEVNYINVERGKHKSDIYLHPSTLSRFGDIERVAVLVNVGGRLVGMDGIPSGTAQQRWWEQLSPQDGYLLNRMQTPFAMIHFDDYEAIKPSRN